MTASSATLFITGQARRANASTTGSGERVGPRGRSPRNTREHLRLGLDLDVDFQTDDGFVVHELKRGGIGHREHRAPTQRSQKPIAGGHVLVRKSGSKIE